MAKKFPRQPRHPERICWGGEKCCAIDDLSCGNGSERTPHPLELLGDDWHLHGDRGWPPTMSPPQTPRAACCQSPGIRHP